MKTFLLLAALSPLAISHAALADHGGYSAAGGTFTVGPAILVQAAPLTGTPATLSLTCPVSSYAAGAYQLNWTCAGGTVTVASTDKSLAVSGTFLSGSMSFAGSGGGRGGHVTYWYQFYGALTGTATAGGVRQAVNGSISFTVKTTSQVGAAGAAVTGLSFGWNSAYSPVLVADAGNARILGADNIAGANLASYGSYGSGSGQFESISGLAEDAQGRIYATDSTLNRLVRIDNLAGDNWTELGSQGTGAMHFSAPRGVTIDAAGAIWVADAGNNRIVRLDDMTGKNWTEFGAAGSGASQFNAPSAIAFDTAGGIYVADAGNNRIVCFDDLTGKNWTLLTQIAIGPNAYPIASPRGLTVRPNGQIVIALADGFLFSVSDMTGANGQASLWSPLIAGIAMDKAGTLYVAGGFNPGLAQTLDPTLAGYFADTLGISGLQASAVAAAAVPSPPPADPVLSASALTFGSRNVGEPGTVQKVRLTNIGAAALNISSISAGADFKLTSGCPAALSGGASCSVGIQFDPVATGARTSTLAVETVSAHAALSVALSGLGTAPTALVSPGQLSFLAQQTGTRSGAQLVTLLNTGSGPLTVSSIAASGDFSETHNCPSLIPAGNGCTIKIAFKPTATGARSGSLTIADDANPAGATQAVALSGTGTAAAPALTLTPESLYFPGQQLNVASGAQTVTLTNHSAAKATLGPAVYSAGFKGSTTCGATLAAAASCVFHVEILPTAPGPLSGSLTIPIAGQAALSAGLYGSGASSGTAAVLTVNPAAIDFGALQTGDNPSLNATISNRSGLPAGIRSISLSGSNAFTVTGNNCPAMLAGGGSCTVQITFQPTVAATYSGNLRVGETSGAKTDVPLSGSASVGGN